MQIKNVLYLLECKPRPPLPNKPSLPQVPTLLITGLLIDLNVATLPSNAEKEIIAYINNEPVHILSTHANL